MNSQCWPSMSWMQEWKGMQPEEDFPPVALDYIEEDTLSVHDRIITLQDLIAVVIADLRAQKLIT